MITSGCETIMLFPSFCQVGITKLDAPGKPGVHDRGNFYKTFRELTLAYTKLSRTSLGFQRHGRSPINGAEPKYQSFHSRYGWLGLGIFCFRLRHETKNAPAIAAITNSAVPIPIHSQVMLTANLEKVKNTGGQIKDSHPRLEFAHACATGHAPFLTAPSAPALRRPT